MKLTTVLYSIAIIILLAAFYSFIQNDLAENIAHYPPKNERIVAFGDSLIAGNGSTPGNDFVSVLGTKLGRPIDNLGVPGDTSGGGLKRVQDVVTLDPGTVILLLGGNDYLRRIPEEETKQNLSEILKTLDANGIVVVLLGVRGGVLRDNREAMYSDLAEAFHTVYIPNVLDDLLGDTEFMDDAIHPNDRGHAVIADRIYEKMAELGYETGS